MDAPQTQHDVSAATAASGTGGMGDYRPAPYGRACKGCSKAKCKCFYRAEGTGCERCFRLGKPCEAAVAVRVRKSRPGPPRPAQVAPVDPKQNRLEEKLDQIVSLLNASERQTPPYLRSGSTPSDGPTPESLTSTAVESTPEQDEAAARYPDAIVDVTSGMVQLLRPGTNAEVSDDDDDGDAQRTGLSPLASLKKLSPVLADISAHHVPDNEALWRLNFFRKFFLPIFAFVHIPGGMSPTELRLRRPFLWLVIMGMTTKSVTEQFQIESTIWGIISKRALHQQHDNLDLVLGVMAFAAWNCYFKEARPHMNLTAALAVALAGELGIQRPRARPECQAKFRIEKGQSQAAPTSLRLEDRRTMLSVYRISSMTWKAYRKTEPIRWTPYLDECLRVLSESGDSPFDALLVAQVKCDRIINELITAQSDALMIGESGTQSSMMASAMLRQLEDIRQGLPRDLKDTKHAQFVLISAELTIRDVCTVTDPMQINSMPATSNLNRLRDLDILLTCVTTWFDTWLSFSTESQLGWSSESHCDFFHASVVIFKLTSLGLPTDPASPETLPVPGWEAAEVRRRADVLELIEKSAARIEAIPPTMGIVDAPGPRRGPFFKIPGLVRGVGAVLKAELMTATTVLEPNQQLPADQAFNGNGAAAGEQQQIPFPNQLPPDAALDPGFSLSTLADSMGGTGFENMDLATSNYFVGALREDPWFSELFPPQWDVQMELDGLLPLQDLQNFGASMPDPSIPDQFSGWGQPQGFSQGGW